MKALHEKLDAFARGYNGGMGSQFQTRIEGTRTKHLMGPVSLKM
jgi:hypothetical protein